MNCIENQVLFIIHNYDFSDVSSFKQEFENSTSCRNLSAGFTQQDVIVKIDGKISNDEKFKNPIIVFSNNENQIVYDNINKIVQIKTVDFSKNRDLAINLLYALAQFRLQDVNRISINFFNKWNNESNKLKIFNAEIHEKLSPWKYNTGFSVNIPIQEPGKNYKEYYKVFKVSGGKDDNDNITDYIYQVNSSYVYDILEDKANLQEQLNKLKEIRDSVEDLHLISNNMCEEIMKL